MKKIICLLVAVAFYSAFSIAQNGPKSEVRAVWLTTIGGLDWPHSYSQSSFSATRQQQELRDILDSLKKANVNTVLLQTRIRGTVIYPSSIEPWDGCLSGFPGRSPGYDALQFAIDECHKRGMELHAWVVAIPVGKWNYLGCKNLRRKYGRLIRNIQDEGYMDPESSVTADHIADICTEITRIYDIDGIHLDYIRYPETWKIRVSPDRGREYITNIVRKVHDAVKSIKPWVKMSCSPVGKYDDLSRYWSHGWNARNAVCQDAQGWLRDGLMDALFPMMYFQGEQFYPFAIDWKEQSYGRIIAPGLGVYFLDPTQKDWSLDVISREMYALRQYGMGHTYFRSKFFTDDTKGIFRFACDEFDRYPSLVPAMTWTSKVHPSAPVILDVRHTPDRDVLSWDGARDLSGTVAYGTKSIDLFYNVYASESYPVDISDVSNLIVVRTPSKKVTVPLSCEETLNYAVTAVDRYGNESSPILSEKAVGNISAHLLANDGCRLRIPAKPSTLDADFVIIKSITGTISATMPYDSNILDISKIPSGFYTIHSLNEKGYTHRLGSFIIKR